MKPALKLVGFGLVLLLVQALGVTLLPESLRPDPMLVFALAMGLRAAGTGGLLLAFLAGFAVDALSGAPLGLFALLRGTACAATRVAGQALYLRATLPWALYVLAYAIADALLLGACLRWFAEDASLLWGTLLWRAPGTALATALLAAPLLAVFCRLDADPGREAGFTFLEPRGSRARP